MERQGISAGNGMSGHEWRMYMKKKRLKRVMALAMAFVMVMGTVIPISAYANATGPDTDTVAGSVEESQTVVLLTVFIDTDLIAIISYSQ